VVASIRVALWALPFRVTRRWVERFGKPPEPSRELDRRTLRRVAWAVDAAARRIPLATCLVRGMAAQILLGRLGQKSVLRLGVARKPDGAFDAHAWVEAQGRIVTGDAVDGFHRYALLKSQTPDNYAKS
jgi:Transglutaminase-like superfamily